MLTARDAEAFALFGFVKIPGFFGPDELAVLAEEHRVGLTATAPLYHAPIGMRGQINWSSMRPRSPNLAKMLEDPRMLQAARTLLGEDAVGVMSNGNSFSGKFTEWHADTSIPDFRSVKFAAYLDPLGADNGALRVLPGSHRDPWHEALLPIGMKTSLKEPGNPKAVETPVYPVPEIPAYVCDTEPGDLLAFDLRLWHASWNGAPNRGMLSFTYFDTPKTPAERDGWIAMAKQLNKEALNREVRRQREWLKAGKGPKDIPGKEPQYHCKWLAEAESNPLRKRWLTRMADWGMVRAPAEAAAPEPAA